MWTLKLCIMGVAMLCDNTTYTNYITEAQCTEAIQVVQAQHLNYIASCERKD